MNFDTKEYYGGLYPDSNIKDEMKTVEVICTFKTYVSVPKEYDDYSKVISYIKDMYSDYELLEESDTIDIEDVKMI